jgi:hypothetical protein
MRRLRIAARQVKAIALLAASISGVLSGCDRPDWKVGGSGGFSGSGGSPSGIGALPAAGTAGSSTPNMPCAIDRIQGDRPILDEQAVNSQFPAPRELYALVTDSEAESLRAGAPLVTPPSQPPTKPAVVQLLESMLAGNSGPQRTLIQSLATGITSTRIAWPNPWALRLVDYPATQHLNPVRIVLREDAWIGRIVGGSLVVLDGANEIVNADVAAATPERIGAIFFTSYQGAGKLGLGACSQGYRAFALGSDEMVDEWSLGTSEIDARLEQDTALLSQLLAVVRNCPAMSSEAFNNDVACNTWSTFNVFSEASAYRWSLAYPLELYKPTPLNLANLIAAVDGDRFEPDPFVSSPNGSAGAGGDGAAGESAVGGAAGSGGAAGADG